MSTTIYLLFRIAPSGVAYDYSYYHTYEAALSAMKTKHGAADYRIAAVDEGR